MRNQHFGERNLCSCGCCTGIYPILEGIRFDSIYRAKTGCKFRLNSVKYRKHVTGGMNS